MTKELAIKILSGETLGTNEQTEEAVKMAVEALKRTETHECDYISRQAAIGAIEEYSDRLNMVNWKENPGVPYKAHALNWCINTIRELPSAQPEPCEDTVKSHSEKDILNMCISLLDEMVGYFGEYMKWIGYEPTEEEKECGYFGMTYFHIVQKLFLYHTTHSGGTSTFEKCHELGVDDPSDGVRFPLWKEEEGDTE